MAGVKGQVQRRGVERRQAIVNAALELFATSGFRATGLATLAERVGVTAPAVLHHFGSKRRLLLAVLEEADRRSAALVDDVFSPGGLEAIGRIRLVARAMVDHPNLPALHLLLEAEHLDEDGPVRDYLLARARGVRALLADAVAVGQERGEIDPAADPLRIATEVSAFLDGAGRAWLVDPDLDLLEMVDGYVSSVQNRLALSEPRTGRPG